MMNTRVRISTLLFCMIILFILGAAIFTYVFKLESRPESWVTPFFAALFFIPFLFVIIRYAKLIRIDELSQTITFSYLFRFQRKRYHFRDITGFRFKYLNGRMDYKALQFQTTSGQKYLVSDFETANLRELEQYCLEHFELRAGKEFRVLNEEEKQSEINESGTFDLSQAKNIRWYYYAAGLTGLVFAIVLIHGLIKNNSPISARNLFPPIVMIAIPVAIIPRIIRINKRIQKLRLHEQS